MTVRPPLSAMAASSMCAPTRVIGIMKDEYGRPIHAAEKVLAMTFRDGKMVETSNQFAIGDAKAREARLEHETGTRQASNSGN